MIYISAVSFFHRLIIHFKISKLQTNEVIIIFFNECLFLNDMPKYTVEHDGICSISFTCIVQYQSVSSRIDCIASQMSKHNYSADQSLTPTV